MIDGLSFFFSYSLLFYPGLKHPGIFFNIQLDRFGKKRGGIK
jgi:hypothetical protein